MAKLGYITVKKGKFMYRIVLDNGEDILLSAAAFKQSGDLINFFDEGKKIVAVFNINYINYIVEI